MPNSEEHKSIPARILEYAEAKRTLLGQFRHFHTDIYGNRNFVEHLHNRGKFIDHKESSEHDLILINYDGEQRLRSYRGVAAIRTKIRTFCPDTTFPPSGSRHKSRHCVAIPGNSQISGPNPAEP